MSKISTDVWHIKKEVDSRFSEASCKGKQYIIAFYFIDQWCITLIHQCILLVLTTQENVFQDKIRELFESAVELELKFSGDCVWNDKWYTWKQEYIIVVRPLFDSVV